MLERGEFTPARQRRDRVGMLLLCAAILRPRGLLTALIAREFACGSSGMPRALRLA